ncbi:hypothetical protein CEXT_177751 [Caerostris extrusa]|uniref:Uncharacterized protein n=1 Tax=Caerostris extrusa TaxID=172846 RepID=A0AAV4N8Z0_CAEEX|nr:hypothetical protein CEXT_177751 [Caerostris extrusa]
MIARGWFVETAPRNMAGYLGMPFFSVINNQNKAKTHRENELLFLDGKRKIAMISRGWFVKKHEMAG